ncbi:MAG: DUF808 domain-containing protein [Pseudomonadota bacterium]
MSSGLLALLDDVAGLAKVAAASVDDVSGLAARAGAKSAAVVIDDTAVTPRFVLGFSAARELPIVAKIARGSLRNKLLYLLPIALGLSLIAPWLMTPLLMFGGLFLCFEGAEKLLEWAGFGHHVSEHEAARPAGISEEDARVQSAIRTDFILSAEIMAITLASVPDAPLWQQAIVLAIVGTGITALVYGAVALIVKADDIGLALAEKAPAAAIRALGRGIVRAMPGLLRVLKIVGTIAMLLVGGGILLHGFETLGFAAPAHLVQRLASDVAPGGLMKWLAEALPTLLGGILVGAILVPLVDRVLKPVITRLNSLR